MTPFSFRTLALAWTGLAGGAIVGAGALQASYMPPPVKVVSAPPPEAAAPPKLPPIPFENRSPVAMLPPHVAPAPVVPPLPVPPIPPPRVAHAEPRRPARPPGTEPSYPGWVETRLPYPGQYASGAMPYYPGQPYGYGWLPEY